MDLCHFFQDLGENTGEKLCILVHYNLHWKALQPTGLLRN